ncbi:MAG: porin [Rhodobacter sp.]|nr:porin [Rhodobacter sp.]
MRPKNRIRILAEASLVALIGAAAGGTALQAQDLPKVETTFANGATLRFYGQINKGFLTYDDGQAAENYNLIDNDNSNTRFGLTYTQDFAGTWTYLGTLEIAYAPYSTSNSNILQPSPPASAYEFTNANIRKIDNKFSNPDVGVFYIGQGDMASNNTAEVDLSGTTVIAYSSVADSAGAQLLRQSDGTLSDIQIKNAFTNYDGLSRKVRIRYDSPSWSGFGLRTSYGRDLLSSNEEVRDQDLYDIAAVYEGAFNDFKVVAQTAYSWKGSDITIFDGSGSVLHVPTGLNFTLAAGSQDNAGVTGSYGYAKLGWQGDLVSWGKTAVSLDYYGGSDIAAEGSDSESWAVALVQNIPRWNTELWMTWRAYDYSETDTEFDSASAVFVGARFKF